MNDCIECGYNTREECPTCTEIVCDDCIEMHNEYEHSDEE